MNYLSENFSNDAKKQKPGQKVAKAPGIEAVLPAVL